MLSTLKDINVAVRELSWTVRKGYCTDEGRKHIVERIKNLKDTQFKISFSVQDLKSDIAKTIGQKEDKRLMRAIFNHDDLIAQLRRL